MVKIALCAALLLSAWGCGAGSSTARRKPSPDTVGLTPEMRKDSPVIKQLSEETIKDHPRETSGDKGAQKVP